MAAGAGAAPRPARDDHFRLSIRSADGVLLRSALHKKPSGQVMVLVAFALLALIASAALILLAGSADWQKIQLHELADSTAMDSALTIGVSCYARKVNA